MPPAHVLVNRLIFKPELKTSLFLFKCDENLPKHRIYGFHSSPPFFIPNRIILIFSGSMRGGVYIFGTAVSQGSDRCATGGETVNRLPA